MTLKKLVILAASLSLLLIHCESTLEGELNENQPPRTKLTVGEINRGEDFRLSSQINISWWGTDSDGYVVGFEYAINDTSEDAWTFTRRSDSTFVLPITQGNVTEDVLFKIRAVDNDGARDPVGAELVYPIVNSTPSVSVNPTETPPDTLFSIASFGWTIDDPDGIANILRTEIAVNDTTGDWISIPIPEDGDRIFISLQVDNSTTGVKDADVFVGRGFSSVPDITVPGLIVGGDNTFYVRVVDNAGAESNVEEINWYIKPQTSSTLFLNDFSGSNSVTNAAFHLDLLAQNGIVPDVWIINDGEVTESKVALSEAFPGIIDPTLTRTLENWDHIYWLSNDIDRNITYALEITNRFFEQNGSMFVTIPMKGIAQTDEIFNFLPIDSIGVLTGIQTNFLIDGNTPIVSSAGVTGTALSFQSRRVGTFPLKAISGSTSLYETDFKATTVIGFNQDYTAFESVAIENPEGDLIYFGLDLTNVNGNGNLPAVMNELLIGRLNFKQ